MSLISSFSSVAGGATSPIRIFAKAGPTVKITSSNMNLTYGSTATLTFSLSSAPGANTFTQSDISITNGALSGFTYIDSKTYKATLTPRSDFLGNVIIAAAYGAFNDVNGVNSNSSSLQIPASTYAPITFTGAMYKYLDDVLLLTGTGFSSLLGAGDESGVTDIKDRLDWSKLSFDVDGNSNAIDVGFGLGDISSAIANTASNILVIKLSSAKAASLEAIANFGGVTLDTLDIATGFSRDAAGYVSTSDGIANAQLPTTISLGSYGNLIAPTTVDGGSRYYYWDRSGNGVSDTSDAQLFTDLQPTFNLDSNGAKNPSGNVVTNNYRYAYFDFKTGAFDNLNPNDSILLALPTLSKPIYSSDSAGTRSSTGTAGNDINNSYDGLTAVWDGNRAAGGTPGWYVGPNSYYWSSTKYQNNPSFYMTLGMHNGYANDMDPSRTDMPQYVALQVQ